MAPAWRRPAAALAESRALFRVGRRDDAPHLDRSRAPTTYGFFNNRKIARGEGEVEISATITPVLRPTGEFFKTYVGLSADPRPKERTYITMDSKPLLVD